MPTIHPLADVHSSYIGDGTFIWQFCVVLKDAKIGKDCNVNCQVFIENDVIIGDRVTIKPGVQIWDGITIEDDVFIGPNVTFTNDMLPRSKNSGYKLEKTVVKKGASIGANSTILPGITIGENSMIGAGSLISKNVPAYHVVYGNPAQHKGYVATIGTIVGLDFKDANGFIYEFQNQELVKKT